MAYTFSPTLYTLNQGCLVGTSVSLANWARGFWLHQLSGCFVVGVLQAVIEITYMVVDKNNLNIFNWCWFIEMPLQIYPRLAVQVIANGALSLQETGSYTLGCFLFAIHKN